MGDTLVIDLETKRTLPEVGGEVNMRDLGISVAGVYSYQKDAFFAFEEHELSAVEAMLKETNHIIGFNINHFDIPVLQPYVPEGLLERIGVTDLFEEPTAFLGFRAGLGSLAKATLGESKSGHGLEALQWFREGRVAEVKKYCLDDVRLTRDLFEFGKKHGHVLFESRNDGKIHSIPVTWGKSAPVPILQIIESAFNGRQRLSIEYVSAEDNDGLGYKKARLIDVYKIKKHEVEAYCHLRQAMRSFRLNRIVAATPIAESYVIPQDLQGALF